eukprot:2679813-Rhodomonas_salina.3
MAEVGELSGDARGPVAALLAQRAVPAVVGRRHARPGVRAASAAGALRRVEAARVSVGRLAAAEAPVRRVARRQHNLHAVVRRRHRDVRASAAVASARSAARAHAPVVGAAHAQRLPAKAEPVATARRRLHARRILRVEEHGLGELERRRHVLALHRDAQ